MSTAQVAVLGRGRVEPPVSASQARRGRGATLFAFFLLGAYAAMRWGTMLSPAPGGQLLGMLLLALVISWLGRHLASERPELRLSALLGIAVCAVLLIPLSGFPMRWVVHLRIAVLVRAVSHGVSSLPHVVVPYAGSSRDTAAVMSLGAAALLLAAALALCAPGRRIGTLRLVAAVIPLVVLGTVPTVLSEPRLAWIHGLVLFALVSGVLFSERVPARRAGGAAAFLSLAAVVALAVGPAIQPRRPWIDVKRIGATPAARAETFNWQQTYRPLHWPHSGTTVLDVQARYPRYWKAEDLDLFNGTAWASVPVGSAYPLFGVSPGNIARWTEKLTVTVRALSIHQVIAAGTASPPVAPGGMILSLGNAPGTYVAQGEMRSGDSYQVDVYAPAPSRHQLAMAGHHYPLADVAPDLQLLIPQASGNGIAQPIQFAPYGSRGRVQYNPNASLSGAATERFLATSAYAPAFRLAERLKASTRTPYQYVRAVMAYLSHGYTYDQSPPTGRYPLLTFLFGSRRGYCQQFAGAMALLLRMAGVPARVAVGFTPGTLDTATHTYLVSDLDAHAWVEAWFPKLGWVTFDPTPGEDPALHGLPGTSFSASGAQPLHGQPTSNRAAPVRAPTPARQRHAHHQARPAGGGVPSWVVVVALLLLLGLLGFAGWRRARSSEALLEELERAFTRCGRPLAPGVTLAELERQFADVPAAAAYVRALRQARYGELSVAPTLDQRRAIRRRLRRGLGPLGSLRALIAFPPNAGRVRSG